MHAQRPPEEIVQAINKTAQEQERIIAIRRKAEEEADRHEMGWVQWEIRKLQAQYRRVYNRMQRRSTGEIQQVQQVGISTPEPMAKDELQREIERVSQSLAQPRPHIAPDPDLPTEQLHHPDEIARIASLPTMMLPNIPTGPIETTYTLDDEITFDNIIASIGYALSAHTHQHHLIGTTIEMNPFIIHTLALRGIHGYPTATGDIHFHENSNLHSYEIKIITLLI